MKKRIAFLGTGIMGSGIARNLLKAGHEITVYNRTAAKTRPLVEAGAATAASPGAAVTDADVIIAIVGDDDSSREVWLGPHGVLTGQPRPNAIAIESTTLSRGWVRELSRRLNNSNLRFIDSPVTGGPGGARDGTLTLLVGAEKESLAEARPVMEEYSHQIIHFGPPGAGTAYKVMVNLMGTVQITALAEGLLLAEKAGLDLGQVRYALKQGAVASPLAKYVIDRMVDENHDEMYFSTRWRHKDAAYGLRLAAEAGQAMPTSAVATELFQLAMRQGLADKNESVVMEVLR